MDEAGRERARWVSLRRRAKDVPLVVPPSYRARAVLGALLDAFVAGDRPPSLADLSRDLVLSERLVSDVKDELAGYGFVKVARPNSGRSGVVLELLFDPINDWAAGRLDLGCGNRTLTDDLSGEMRTSTEDLRGDFSTSTAPLRVENRTASGLSGDLRTPTSRAHVTAAAVGEPSPESFVLSPEADDIRSRLGQTWQVPVSARGMHRELQNWVDRGFGWTEFDFAGGQAFRNNKRNWGYVVVIFERLWRERTGGNVVPLESYREASL